MDIQYRRFVRTFRRPARSSESIHLDIFDNLNLELKDLADQGSTLFRYCSNCRTDCGRWFAWASFATLASNDLLTGSKALPISWRNFIVSCQHAVSVDRWYVCINAYWHSYPSFWAVINFDKIVRKNEFQILKPIFTARVSSGHLGPDSPEPALLR